MSGQFYRHVVRPDEAGPLAVGWAGQARGVIAVADAIKPSARLLQLHLGPGYRIRRLCELVASRAGSDVNLDEPNG